jgi:hypothetical protein
VSPASRGVIVLSRGVSSDRVAPYCFGCPLPVRSSRECGLRGLSRPDHLPELRPLPGWSEKEPSPEVRLPFRVLPGCTARAAFAVLSSPACADARVRLSWGSSSLRRLTQGAPFLPRSARPTAGDEGYHTLARFRPRASSTRPSSPCGALDRASVAPRRFEPRRLLQARVSPFPQFRRRYAPELRDRLPDRARPWDSPFRAFPSRGAVPPLGGLLLPRGFDVDRDPGAKTPCVSDRFPPCAASWPCSEPPRRDDRARLETREHRLPATVSPPHHHASFPARRLSERQRTFGLAGTRPCRPPRSFAPLGSPFTRPTAPFPRTCARGIARPTGPVLSWVFAPSEPTPPRPRVRFDCDDHPGANPSDRGSPSPAPDDRAQGFDPEV